MPINASDYCRSAPAKPDAWLYLDEITHRTLNDYSVMLAMVRRASAGATDAGGLAALDAVAKRLEASASAFGALRPSRASPTRNLDDDLERLCASLSSSTLADQKICLRLSAEPVLMSSHRSWQVSLIVSELIMNAAKHAFSRLTSGTIIVDVRTDGRSVTCLVMDNGKAGSNPVPGRGSRIVDGLVADLGGTVVRHFSRSGATVCLHVPMV